MNESILELHSSIRWERGHPCPHSAEGANDFSNGIPFRASRSMQAGCPRSQQLLEFRVAFLNKRAVRFVKIRRLHAQGLRYSFGFQRSVEAHVHFAIQHLFCLG